ncbi:hypothetical protein EB118_06340 [bacterium]|nr:hypothetical protein [bacterium]NDC94375.1 hypothetical protein [bacterium]NDD83921.1 hypothetical protein [bacterium]NDG29697.1 hypothetical protein [bacterium]
MNRTSDDQCYIQRKDIDNNKKLKFVTTSHRDLLDAKKEMNFFGIGIRDQLFVPEEAMDTSSDLRNGTLTNFAVRQNLGQLPLPTLPSKYQTAHGALNDTDFQVYLWETDRKACKPKGTEHYLRSFGIFDDAQGIETPRAELSVENELRCGKSTRFT